MAEVALEVAEDEFARMVESYDLDLDDMDKEDNELFQTIKKYLIKAIAQGRVTVNEAGNPTVHLKYPVGEITSVSLKHPTGETLISKGDQKSKNIVSAGWKLLQDFSGVPSTAFGKMRQNPDLKTCNYLLQVFLG